MKKLAGDSGSPSDPLASIDPRPIGLHTVEYWTSNVLEHRCLSLQISTSSADQLDDARTSILVKKRSAAHADRFIDHTSQRVHNDENKVQKDQDENRFLWISLSNRFKSEEDSREIQSTQNIVNFVSYLRQKFCNP